MRLLVLLFSLVIMLESKAETLKVALMDQRPFAWQAETEMKGFHYDVAKKLAEKAGYSLDAHLVPVLRVPKMLGNHQVDFVIMRNVQAFEALKTKKIFLSDSTLEVYFKQENSPLFKNGISGHIGRLKNACKELSTKSGIKWMELQNFEQGYELLKANRIDGVCGSIAFMYAARLKKARDSEIKSILVSKSPIWIHVMPDIDPKKWQAIESAANFLVKNGTVERLYREYEDINR